MIRVLIVDDLKIIYKGLETMLAGEQDLSLIGYAANGKEAITQITNAESKPDVVLLDLLMPVMSGVETTQQITRLFPEIKVIILSGFADDPMILQAIAAGAKGYLLKTMMAQDLAAAIRLVYRGSSNFAPGVIDSLTKNWLQKSTPKDTLAPVQPIIKPKTKLLKPKPEKPLFKYGDWLTVIISGIALSQVNGMGHYLAHTGLLLLALSLLARPLKSWWSWPLKHRRAIGIIAFAATVSHAFYATFKIFNLDWQTILGMSAKNKWGIALGVIALLMMTPAAITSFQFFQRQLGKTWQQIHRLTIPALALAILHTILAGSSYMGLYQIESIDYVKSLGIIIGGFLVLLIRHKSFKSLLGWNKLKQFNQKVTAVIPRKPSQLAKD